MGRCLFMRKGSVHTVPGSRLPTGYTELVYIQSSGTQYIATLFKPNQNTKVVCTVSGYSKDTSSATNLFGCRTSTSASDMFSFNISGSTCYRSDFYNSRVNFSSSIAYTGIMTVTKDKNSCTIESGGVSTTVSNASGTFSCAYDMYILGENRGGAVHTPPSIKLYSCQIYDNGTLVRDFVPCIKDDGKVGLYDIVGKQFYGNAGTGVFTGSEVT